MHAFSLKKNFKKPQGGKKKKETLMLDEEKQ